LPASRLLACLLDAEELETLVVIVVATRDRREVVAAASREG
jgi:hypothetical protein